jgi:hypothetical protein
MSDPTANGLYGRKHVNNHAHGAWLDSRLFGPRWMAGTPFSVTKHRFTSAVPLMLGTKSSESVC